MSQQFKQVMLDIQNVCTGGPSTYICAANTVLGCCGCVLHLCRQIRCSHTTYLYRGPHCHLIQNLYSITLSRLKLTISASRIRNLSTSAV